MGLLPRAVPVVTVAVTAPEVDAVSGRLWLAGATAVTEEPGRLVAGFDDEEAAGTAAAEVGGTVEHVDPGVWLDAWREFAVTVRVPPLVVHPAWTDPPALAPGEVLVEIDPGRVFGHGGHPTTRLCLDEVVRRRAERVLDVGCGSGVLSVAAALLGATQVAAVDIDPDAVEVTLANAARNGVRVDASTSMPDPGAYDLVLANIGGDTVVELALRAPVVVLSGFLVDRAGEVAAAYAAAGASTVTELDGWAAVTVTA